MNGNNHQNGRSAILVTGSHRSGTTWVGKVIGSHPDLEYIQEPLNANITPETWGVLPVERPFWYQHIGDHNESRFLPAYQRMLNFRYDILAALSRLSNVDGYGKEEIKVIDTYVRFANAHLRRATPLIKDPFAVVSVPWFVERLNTQVVVTIRHPAGFVSSLHRLGWSFGLDDFLGQPELMKQYPIPEDDIEAHERFKRDNNDLAAMALGWKHIYRIVKQLLASHPDLVYVRHRDLSLHPREMFQKVFERLNLSWTPEVDQFVQQSTSRSNPSELATNRHHLVHMDSRKGVENWKKRLKSHEIDTIREVVEEVSAEFYTDDEW